MVVCSHCGRESRAADRFCQYCGQQLDPDNGHLVAARASHYASASGEPEGWQGPLAGAASASSPVQHSSQGVSPTHTQPSGHARLVVRQAPETSDAGHSSATDAEGREYQLDGGDVAIGRAPSCDVVLEGDQLASRRHALLRGHGNVYTVVDLGSSNGTYVNDLEIREATVLKDGDVITIGAHEIIFSTAPASPHASIPGAALAGTPAAPLSETDPSVSAVNAPADASAAGEQPAADGMAVASSEAPAGDAGAQPQPSDTDLSPDVSAVEQAESDVADAGAGATSVDSIVENMPVEVAAPDAAGSNEAFAVALVPSHTATSAADLEALRVQLAEISAALARKADEEARAAGRLRATLADARDRLAALAEQRAKLAEQSTQEEAPVSTANVSELVSVARQAAENPRHLDYLTTFAAHAAEIATALEALEAHQASATSSSDNTELLDVLGELRARLDDALK